MFARLESGLYVVGLSCGHMQLRRYVEAEEGTRTTWSYCNKCREREYSRVAS